MECISYDTLKHQLLQVKSSIDEIVSKKGIVEEIKTFESKLDDIYAKIIMLNINLYDKYFVAFNYYAPKSCIYLSKNQNFKAVISFLNSIFYFSLYLKKLKENTKWINSIKKYYMPLLRYQTLDLFGNTSKVQFEEIKEKLTEVIQAKQKLLGKVKSELNRLIISFIFSLITQSSEIYTNEHMNNCLAVHKIINTLKDEDIDDFLKGKLYCAKFILLKKKLHYYLRNLVPKKNKQHFKEHLATEKIEKEVKRVIDVMKKTANEEYKFFKKSEKVTKKIFLAKLDKLVCEFYNLLWVHRDFIKALKKMGEIFSEIRKNIKLIRSSQIFWYFVQEYKLLNNYFKICLLKKDFENFGKNIAEKDWQREIALNISDELSRITKSYFKYIEPKSTDRELMIVERTVSGKFIEFVVFYLLREFIENNLNFSKVTHNLSDSDLKEFFSILSKIKDKKEIIWDFKVKNFDSDIDIFISNKYGVFLKSGILNNADREKIFEEIKLSETLRLEKVFIIIDIAKNIEFVRKLEKFEVILLDIGDFLRVLLDIATKNKSISFNLSKSGVLGYAGFYS